MKRRIAVPPSLRRALLAAGVALSTIAAAVLSTLGAAALSTAAAARAAERDAAGGAPYPLSTCPVSGKRLESVKKPVVYVHDGSEIRFCTSGCLEKFRSSPGDYLKKVQAEIAKDQKPGYPLETCLVSGQKLGGMGEPVDRVRGNRLFRLCCKGCIPKLEKETETYARRLDEAVVARGKASYPLTECVISGQKLGSMGDPVDLVVGGRLVRLCCKGCVARVKESPAAVLERVRTAAGGSSSGAKEPGAKHDHGAKDHGGNEHGANEPGANEPGANEPGAKEPGAKEPGAHPHHGGHEPHSGTHGKAH